MGVGEILNFGKRRIGKSNLPQDQIAKRNEFDETARQLACFLRRAKLCDIGSDSEITVSFKTPVEGREFLRLTLLLKRRRRNGDRIR